MERREDGRHGYVIEPQLRLVAWEITRRCNLFCAHCRGSATGEGGANELSTEECLNLVDQIADVARPILILSGGEPLMRADLLDVARYAVRRGLRVVMGTNGTLLTPEVASALKKVPFSRIAVSIDFPEAGRQDEFRGKAGAFEEALEGLKNARRAGIETQVNSTISRLNVEYMEALLCLALEVGAAAFHPFFLVPTGRGRGLEWAELSPEEYEASLNWIFEKQQELGDRMFFKPTDAPHYMRVVSQRRKENHLVSPVRSAGHPANVITRGCLAGTGYCFISSEGKVQGCGYLDVEAGDVRKQPFGQIWSESPLFRNLRDTSNIKGKCGVCEYKPVCGGCRARAYEATGDYLESEPYCVYQPSKHKVTWK